MSASRISPFSIAPLTVALLMLGVASVHAQGRVRGLGGNDQGLQLLVSRQVQEELDLVDDQIEKIKDLQSRQREEMREIFMSMRSRFRDMDRGSREEIMGEIREKMTTLNEKFSGEASEILLPHQVTRWEQLKFQSQAQRAGGADRFIASPAIAEKLNITETQLEAMKAKAEEIRESMQKKIAAIRAEAQDELLSVLTPEQQEQFKSLSGDAFTFDERQQRGWGDWGRGRGGDRGRGGRGGEGGAGGRRGGQGGPGGRSGLRGRDGDNGGASADDA